VSIPSNSPFFSNHRQNRTIAEALKLFVDALEVIADSLIVGGLDAGQGII
jgi:hypothetical protein